MHSKPRGTFRCLPCGVDAYGTVGLAPAHTNTQAG